jgi:hypothetical protein
MLATHAMNYKMTPPGQLINHGLHILRTNTNADNHIEKRKLFMPTSPPLRANWVPIPETVA